MPETKFTPGPWDFDRSIWWENTPGEQEKHGSLVVYPSNNPNGDDLTIAEVNDFFDKEIGKANAHLITASPDLYAALLELKQMLGNEGEYSVCRSDRKPMDFPEVITVGSVFERASDALAKARGES